MDRKGMEIKGLDGIDLLHRISTWNAHKREIGVPTDALFLTPSGKIISAFTITPLSTDTLQVELDPLPDDSNRTQFLKILEQFTFAEHYTLKEIPLDPKPGTEEERIRSGRALIGKEFHPNEKTNPLEVNLAHAIADQKGCYPGQEVIEKMISIGSSPKRLVTLKSLSRIEEGDPIMDASQQVGTVTSAVQDGPFWFALAIVRKTHCKVGHTFTHRGNTLEIISQN
jgi:folate-binding protein YgfZ